MLFPALLSAVLAAVPGDDGRNLVRVVSEGFGEAPCPTERALLQRVASRLGYDPFDDGAKVELRVRLRADAQGAWVATIERRENGAVTGRRSVGPSRDCVALGGALELALALAVDPLLESSAHGEPEPSPAPAPVPPPAPVAAEPWSWALGLAGGAVFAALPTVRPAFALEVSTRNGALQLLGELQATVPGSVAAAGGAVWSTSASLAVMPCWRWRVLAACGRVAAAVLHFDATAVPAASRATVPTVSLGARILAELPIVGRFSARVFGDLDLPLSRTTVFVGSAEVWVSPLVQGQVALAAVLAL